MEWVFSRKKTKWRTVHPEGVACLNPSSTEPIFAERGPVTSGRPGNRSRNRFGTNIKLFRGVMDPISTPNDNLNAIFDAVISLC